MASLPVCLFYRPTGEFGAFSNFFEHRFRFVFPAIIAETEPQWVFCSEQAFMLVKAAFFKDFQNFSLILQAKTAYQCKVLGRQVRNYDDSWDTHKEEIMYEILLQKFQSSGELKYLLLSTGNRVLAEASQRDKIWGIGLHVGHKLAHNPLNFKGKNLLGLCLMKVRSTIANDENCP